MVLFYLLYTINCSQKMILQNSIQSHSKKVTEQKISLFNLLTCLLCSSKAKIAHICPTCSKFYCETCIKTWIRMGNSYCLNCKGHINENNIVNCNKLSEDLSNALEALIQLQTPQELICITHGIPQVYYCSDCHIAICSDCIVLETNHRRHNVGKLNKIKMEFNQQILLLLSKIRKNMKEIEKMREESMVMKGNQGEILKNKIEILNKHTEKVKCNFNDTINQTSRKLEEIFERNNLMQISGNKIYEQFLSEIKEMSKISLVRKKQQELEKIIEQSINQSNLGSLDNPQLFKISHKSQIQNIITSKFAQKTFILNNYTKIREKKEVVYSDSFFSGPLEWRLKVYPNGLEKKREGLGLYRQRSMNHINYGQEYISIYIELVSGVREGGRYRFNIQILNQNDVNNGISQIYQADFDAGKCWGYDQFANISTLYQKGYILQEEDALKISVLVGPPSYYFSSLDQDAIIRQKEQLISLNKQKIQNLRNNLHNFKHQSKQKIEKFPLGSHQQDQRITLLADISTPPCGICLTSQQGNKNQNIEKGQDTIDFENYVVKTADEDIRCTEQYDQQSVEMKKIYRRLSHINDRSNVLLF